MWVSLNCTVYNKEIEYFAYTIAVVQDAHERLVNNVYVLSICHRDNGNLVYNEVKQLEVISRIIYLSRLR